MLTIDNLTLRFGGLVAVNDVTLTVQAGKISGLIGPNGAGKTTTLSTVSGLTEARGVRGKIAFQGRNIAGLKGNRVAARGLVQVLEGRHICARIPMIMGNHKECIQVCLRTCVESDKLNPRLVRIPNSLHLEHIMLSEAYWAEAAANPDLVVESEPAELVFDAAGNLF